MTPTERTYMALLLLPYGHLRVKLDPELARCRDLIALETGRDAETIQNAYEAIAHQLGKFIQALPEVARNYSTARGDGEKANGE